MRRRHYHADEQSDGRVGRETQGWQGYVQGRQRGVRRRLLVRHAVRGQGGDQPRGADRRRADGSLYTGITNNLRRRLAAHRAGTASRYTRARRPVRLVYQERRRTRSAALRREAAIKRLPRATKLKMLGR